MSLITSPTAQLEVWRQKVKDGTITTEELREAIRYIREGRMTAGAAKPKANKGIRPTGGAPLSQADTDAILGELGDL